MKHNSRGKKGALTIEACIAYPIFVMVIMTIFYLMRVVYAYGLVQHAVAQTAKELSMYTYIYQITGMNDTYQSLKGSTEERKAQFDKDAEDVVKLYETLQSGNYSEASYSGTVNPVDILKNVGSALVSEAATEVNHRIFQTIAKPMMAGYIGSDSEGNSADERLKALRVINGMNGIDLSSSSFFEDGSTIDLVACYTIDPLLPVDVMPEFHMMNRASVRGMSGEAVFSRNEHSSEDRTDEKDKKEKSVWDMESDVKRGKAIQEQEGVRNLPDNFSTYSAYHSQTGKATAEMSIDLRRASYQKESGIRNAIRQKCSKMENYKKTTYDGVTLDPAEIKSKELILYIPSSKGDRQIDRSQFDKAVRTVKKDYPDIKITIKEID